MVGNTLLKWGTEEQKRQFLPRILSGEDTWCQGFSEPNAGSDLASLSTRATLDGDEWVIDGQKIWTSFATQANWIFVLARTDPTVPKHRGISFLLCPMDTPGVEVRPIRMLTGGSEFNEVFFDGARVPQGNVVGPVHGGWAVAMSLLGHERGEEAALNPIMFRHEYDRLVALAREYGRIDDPLIRDAARVVLRTGRDHATARPAHPHAVPPRRRSRTRGVDLQALLERVPPGRREPGDGDHGASRARCPKGTYRRAPTAPTIPARRTPPRRGSTCGC